MTAAKKNGQQKETPGSVPNTAAGKVKIAAQIENSGDVSVKLAFPVGKSQRVVLLLNEFLPESSPAKAYSFNAPKRDGDTDSITIPTNGVEPGEYLMRLQVDGAESPMEVDTDETSPTFDHYIGPRVEFE